MSLLHLKYGRETIPFEYDPDRFQVLSKETTATPLTDNQIGAALDQPIDSPPLSDVVQPGDTVLIVTSDATRQTGSAQVVNLLVRRLIEHGVMPFDMRIIFAAGTHRAVTAAEQRELLTPFIAQRITTLVHDAHDEAAMIDLGSEIDGVPIRVNRALREFDKVILVGGTSFHYFAGFGGGRKSICPGLAWVETVKAVHRRALDFDRLDRRTGVDTALLDGNAMHEACDHIAALIDPAFSINTVVNEEGKVTAVYAGHWRTAHRRACDDYLAEHSIVIPAKRELVVVSAGGWPYDINLIQAHKALEMAAHACAEGGTIVWLAECSEGLGRPDFLQWFDAPDARALVEQLRTDYQVNGQTAWSLREKAERFRIHLVSGLPPDSVPAMGIAPAQTIDDAFKACPPSVGYVITDGAKLLPVPDR
jgi:nickel-dependent lactate racemase